MTNEQIIAAARQLLRVDLPIAEGAVQKIYFIKRTDIYKPLPENPDALRCIVHFAVVDGEWTFQSLTKN